MADISAELQAILDATYGEEVRGSIHDAIEKINTVNENSASSIEAACSTLRETLSNFSNQNASVVICSARADKLSIGSLIHGGSKDFEVEIPITKIYGDSSLIELSTNYDDAECQIFHIPIMFNSYVTELIDDEYSQFPTYMSNGVDERYAITSISPLQITVQYQSYFYTKDFTNNERTVRVHGHIENYTPQTYSELFLTAYITLLTIKVPKGYKPFEWSVDDLLSLASGEYGSLSDLVDITFTSSRGGYKFNPNGLNGTAVFRMTLDKIDGRSVYYYPFCALLDATVNACIQSLMLVDVTNPEMPIILDSWSGNNFKNSIKFIAKEFYANPVNISRRTVLEWRVTVNGSAGSDEYILFYPDARSPISPASLKIASGTGTNSVIENDLTSNTASGNCSHAEGSYTTASGDYSHAEGSGTKASGHYSHAEGSDTTASGHYSHAEGSDTTASGFYSHAEGSGTKASGFYSHAEGSGTTASRYCSHAEGEGTKAESEAQHVSGKYNVADSQGVYAEIIGNGSADNARSNARTLDWDGNEWLAGYLELGPNRARLTPEMISHIDGIASTIKSMLTTETVNGNPIILDDAAENMEPVELEVGLLYTKDESTGAITGYTSGSVTVNSDAITTNFPQEAGLVCGGKYDPVNGTLTVTKIGVQAAWGDMIFSIDPDNYLGKRIALTDCFGGLAGAEISDCHVLSGGTNLSPDYIYDQSAATHFYVYNDNIDSYAVVVLPDTTPSDAVITVVGTLKNPITYEVTASEILLALEDNTISSNMNAPMKLTYYHDAIRQEQADIQNAKPIFSDPNNDGNIVIYFADEV